MYVCLFSTYVLTKEKRKVKMQHNRKTKTGCSVYRENIVNNRTDLKNFVDFHNE